MRIREYPTQEKLKDIFDYKDGSLVRKKVSSGRVRLTHVAGYKTKYGYIRVKVNGVDYQAHRLIWIWHNGHIDVNMEIDHIDRVRDNNKIENLRPLPRLMNRKNSKHKGYTHNTRSGKWIARIMVDYKSVFLGAYDSEADAHTAYLEAKKIYHKIEKLK